MVYGNRSALSAFTSDLLASGRTVFVAQEAEELLGIEHGAFLDSAERLQKRKILLSPRRSFYVVIPPQFATWGAPPPAWYIDALMQHESEPYYVALLKAAEFHGSTHQAAMEFQVIVAKRIPKIRAGRSLISFYYRKNMKAVAQGVEKQKTDTGTMQVSSPALTALDLMRYRQASAGIDHISMVLSEIGRKINAEQLASLSVYFERPVSQRLGYLLDSLDLDAHADRMHSRLFKSGRPPWVELDRAEVRYSYFKSDPTERNQRWRVVVRRLPESDQ